MVFNELKRYLKGKIYKITNDINEDIYIGSTTNYIEARWGQHITDAYKEENQNKPLYKMIREIGFKHFNIELICEYPCINRGKLEEEENKYIKQYGTLNIKNNDKSERHIKSINKQTNKIISDILNNIIDDVIHYTLYDKYINNFINKNFKITKSYKNRIFIREIIDLIEIDESSIDKKDFLKIVKEKIERLGGIYDNSIWSNKKVSTGFKYVSLKI